MKTHHCFALMLALVLFAVIGATSPVLAQEQPPPDQPDPAAAEPAPQPQPPAGPDDALDIPLDDDHSGGLAAPAQPPPPAPPRPPPAPIRFPYLFNAPTARLLPGAVIYTGGGLDTGGGVSSVLQVGLGDVAEFGVALTDLVRAKNAGDANASAIFPYVTATFKMGVAESRLFKAQPALALGFRKSFEREVDGHATRIAELYLIGSKDLGSRTTIHLGGVLWDASLTTGTTTHELNEGSVSQQLRAFGGVEITPLPKAQIMVELLWMPEFNYGATAADDEIKLNATLAWGVRYQLADWMVLESGVRVPEISDANLLNAQIFGQVKFVNRGFRRVVGLE